MFSPKSYLKTLKSQFQNPKFHIYISQIHNPTSKNPKLYNPAIQFILNEAKEFQSSNPQFNPNAQNEKEKIFPQKQNENFPKIQISHPWREWVDLMEKLLKNGYFDAIGNPFGNNGELGNKEANLIRTACLNFARGHSQLIRYLSRKDIMVIAGSGCPSTDRKVVNSGKRLRAHVGIDEGNVCSSCALRGDCDRAYVKARDDERCRTVDVMRILLTYGLDPILGSVANKPCLNKRVKDSVRTLLTEMVEIRVERDDCETTKANTLKCNLSVQENDIAQERRKKTFPMKQGDWICPKCNFLNFARNVKCLRCDELSEERVKRLVEEQEDLPLKKGDWRCDKCKFLNFARNTKCLVCKEKPAKREINPGEWECDSCNYINFRRNMVCLKCNHKRPIASFTADIVSPPVKDDYIQPSFKFVDNDSQDHHSNSSSLNEDRVFMDFPVIGGKSALSRDLEKHELWKIEMCNQNRTRESTGKRNTSNYHRRKEYLGFGDDDDDDDDDDDEMIEWFEGRKKP